MAFSRRVTFGARPSADVTLQRHVHPSAYRTVDTRQAEINRTRDTAHSLQQCNKSDVDPAGAISTGRCVRTWYVSTVDSSLHSGLGTCWMLSTGTRSRDGGRHRVMRLNGGAVWDQPKPLSSTTR